MVGNITVPFDTGVGTQNLVYELGKLDLSAADWLKVIFNITKADTDAGDTLNAYLQARDRNGIWRDIIAFTQVIGTLSPSGSAPEVLEANLMQGGTLSDDEEESETYGSAGASHLTAGTVRNGPLPGMYHGSDGVRGASLRIRLESVDSDNDADYEGSFYIQWNECV